MPQEKEQNPVLAAKWPKSKVQAHHVKDSHRGAANVADSAGVRHWTPIQGCSRVFRGSSSIAVISQDNTDTTVPGGDAPAHKQDAHLEGMRWPLVTAFWAHCRLGEPQLWDGCALVHSSHVTRKRGRSPLGLSTGFQKAQKPHLEGGWAELG